jgi:Exonuclease VII small subunit
MEQDDMQQNDLKLEEVLIQVEQCIGQLENPQVPLEEAFRYYEEGIKKLRLCNEKIDQIEKKMLVIGSQGELEEF